MQAERRADILILSAMPRRSQPKPRNRLPQGNPRQVKLILFPPMTVLLPTLLNPPSCEGGLMFCRVGKYQLAYKGGELRLYRHLGSLGKFREVRDLGRGSKSWR